MVNQNLITIRNATREDVDLLCGWWADQLGCERTAVDFELTRNNFKATL